MKRGCATQSAAGFIRRFGPFRIIDVPKREPLRRGMTTTSWPCAAGRTHYEVSFDLFDRRISLGVAI